MFKKFYLKVTNEHEMKVRGLLIERYQGICGCTMKSDSRQHEYILSIGPFKYKRFKQDLDRAMKMGLIAEMEEF